MSIARFNELPLWQKSFEIVKLVYQLTNNAKFAKDFGLKDQVRRSALSVNLNIAEGFERKGNKEFIRFLNISKGSLWETRAAIYVAKEFGYITDEEYRIVDALLDETVRQIVGLIKHLLK